MIRLTNITLRTLLTAPKEIKIDSFELFHRQRNNQIQRTKIINTIWRVRLAFCIFRICVSKRSAPDSEGKLRLSPRAVWISRPLPKKRKVRNFRHYEINCKAAIGFGVKIVYRFVDLHAGVGYPCEFVLMLRWSLSWAHLSFFSFSAKIGARKRASKRNKQSKWCNQ